MSFRSLESMVLAELREVAKKRSIRLKDIMEWSTGEVKAQAGETFYRLPDLNINCAVKTSALGKRIADALEKK